MEMDRCDHEGPTQPAKMVRFYSGEGVEPLNSFELASNDRYNRTEHAQKRGC